MPVQAEYWPFQISTDPISQERWNALIIGNQVVIVKEYEDTSYLAESSIKEPHTCRTGFKTKYNYCYLLCKSTYLTPPNRKRHAVGPQEILVHYLRVTLKTFRAKKYSNGFLELRTYCLHYLKKKFSGKAGTLHLFHCQGIWIFQVSWCMFICSSYSRGRWWCYQLLERKTNSFEVCYTD